MLKLKKLIIVLLCLAGLSLLGFWAYVQVRTYPAETAYLALIMADESVEITKERNYYLVQAETLDLAAWPIIYYPGGLVAPEAYLHIMGMVAAELGTRVFIIKAPFNAAIFNTGAAGAIIDKHALEAVWVGGHSLGGIAACRYAAANPGKVYGLFLFGSYCDQEISTFQGPVVSIMGLNDLIINRENYREAKSKLPVEATIVEIVEVEGLNHSAFGNYGLQKGDGESSLSDEQVIELIVSVFEKN